MRDQSESLASGFTTPVDEWRSLLHNERGMNMKMLEIKKRSGGTRTVCVPSRTRKQRCRDMIPMLQKLVNTHCNMDVVHGFAPLRSPVTNATRHIGFRFTASFDLKDFFDTVTPYRGDAHRVSPSKIGRRAVWSATNDLWHKGVAKQGLPTSPIVANLAAAGMDRKILGLLVGIGRFSYTRYADDLCISFDDPAALATIKLRVAEIVFTEGFALNDKKTTVQAASSGRRIITGVAVDDTGLHPTRAAKRRLRAAKHNAETGKVKHFPKRQWTRHVKIRKHHGSPPLPQKVWLGRWLQQKVAGLTEWCRLKPPGFGKKSAMRIIAVTEGVDTLTALSERTAP